MDRATIGCHAVRRSGHNQLQLGLLFKVSLGPPPERKTSKEPARGVSPNYFAADNLIVTLRLVGGGAWTVTLSLV